MALSTTLIPTLRAYLHIIKQPNRTTEHGKQQPILFASIRTLGSCKALLIHKADVIGAALGHGIIHPSFFHSLIKNPAANSGVF